MSRLTVRRAAALALATTAVMSACAPSKGRAVPWEDARLDGPQVVTVSLWGSTPLRGPEDFCGADYTAVASESAKAVTITVFELRNTPPPGVAIACPAIVRRVESSVKLTEPLGLRTLIDGATGQPKPLSPI